MSSPCMESVRLSPVLPYHAKVLPFTIITWDSHHGKHDGERAYYYPGRLGLFAIKVAADV